ncbi:MAG: hypothetical protein PHV34_16535 [Verrucomicrobiae bacterium]|nr:hypothetical protein [Verrucomicrobiae bacterium]
MGKIKKMAERLNVKPKTATKKCRFPDADVVEPFRVQVQHTSIFFRNAPAQGHRLLSSKTGATHVLPTTCHFLALRGAGAKVPGRGAAISRVQPG